MLGESFQPTREKQSRNEDPENWAARCENALIQVAMLRQQIMVTGSVDSEKERFDAIEREIQELMKSQKSGVSPEEFVAKAQGIVLMRQDYH